MFARFVLLSFFIIITGLFDAVNDDTVNIGYGNPELKRLHHF